MKKSIIWMFLFVLSCPLAYAAENITVGEYGDKIIQDKLLAMEKEQTTIQKNYDEGQRKLNAMRDRFIQNAGSIRALREIARDAKTGQFISKETAQANPGTTVVEKVEAKQ